MSILSEVTAKVMVSSPLDRRPFSALGMIKTIIQAAYDFLDRFFVHRSMMENSV